jgi:hypothetical protein
MAGITAIGGVEAVVKVLQSFPKYHDLQWRGCRVLHNLVCCSIAVAKAIELGEIEHLLLAAVNTSSLL